MSEKAASRKQPPEEQPLIANRQTVNTFSDKVYLSHGSCDVRAPVKEVGPWNTYDNWWGRSRKRTMCKDLPRGLPEAEAQLYKNYKNKDEFGREVLNPAGVELMPAVAAKLGLGKYENAWFWVWQPD